MTKFQVGQIVVAPKNAYSFYFIEEMKDNAGVMHPYGPYLCGPKGERSKGQHVNRYFLNTCEPVPEDDVPDFVWRYLGEWKLTGDEESWPAS